MYIAQSYIPAYASDSFWSSSFTLDPMMLPHLQVDKGAIRFILSGANIMCPGLTSPGAKMDDVEANKVVAIMAEGKDHACAVGLTKLSTEEILKINKGIGVDNIHFLCDGLWVMKRLD
eukprot:m.16589 g.16589  ORF g.16589 m.16589 type:complete len:118 (+) comp27026_c0_seq4:365-718(+)